MVTPNLLGDTVVSYATKSNGKDWSHDMRRSMAGNAGTEGRHPESDGSAAVRLAPASRESAELADIGLVKVPESKFLAVP